MLCSSHTHYMCIVFYYIHAICMQHNNNKTYFRYINFISCDIRYQSRNDLRYFFFILKLWYILDILGSEKNLVMHNFPSPLKYYIKYIYDMLPQFKCCFQISVLISQLCNVFFFLCTHSLLPTTMSHIYIYKQ